MAQAYTATAKRNPGRQAWLVEFRHPLKPDGNKPGKKTRKGLGTSDEGRAQLLVQQLNELLRNETLWSLGARAEAAKLYEPEVLEIFYAEIEPREQDARALRDKLLPLPQREAGYAKVVMIGVPGSGKTTLGRQLIGTHPKREAFPAASLNRTTTFPTELVFKDGKYEAVVTFISEYEARFEIEECVSSAVVDAVEGDRSQVARTFLEKSDMRFRLKYLLGDLGEADEENDPYAEDLPDDTAVEENEGSGVTETESQHNADKVNEYIDRIFEIATKYRALVEGADMPLAQMQPADRTAALELIEEQADASDEFLALVSDILEEIRAKFSGIGGGNLEPKTTTGWPKAWSIKVDAGKRAELFSSLRCFSSVSDRYWGRLLTPLVNGLRVQGPFKPVWTQAEPRLVLMDTEGLGHKANSTADLTEQTIALLHEADVILLVDSAKNGMTNFAAGKALESIANTGLTRKLAMVFTHMDMAKESGLKGPRLHDQIFAGLRNVVNNQLEKSVATESARFLLDQLQKHTFYVGRIDKAEPKGAEPELQKLLAHLMAEQPPVIKPVSFPEYDMKFLMMAVHEAAKDFREHWQHTLGVTPWQTIKALSRRYADNFGGENFELRPTANLRTYLESAVSRFLESPIRWAGDPTIEQKRDAIERIKSIVAKQLPSLARRRLRESPQPEWYSAWMLRGVGSTSIRRMYIENIYKRWVPIPEIRGDQLVLDFISEVERLVESTLEDFRNEVNGKND